MMKNTDFDKESCFNWLAQPISLENLDVTHGQYDKNYLTSGTW